MQSSTYNTAVAIYSFSLVNPPFDFFIKNAIIAERFPYVTSDGELYWRSIKL